MAEVKPKPTPRVLSGVQPSGKLHLGNYFGAIRQHIAAQEFGECFFFIADYHSMTSLTDPKIRLQNTQDVALDYLALGLDPEKTAFFRQSDVPEVCELAWMFSTLSGMGLLERAVSFKDKVSRGLEANVGLFTYPILQAADILIYRSNLVPVGEDQVQHIEMTRDIGERFNRVYQQEIFPIPEYRLSIAPKVPGTDGQKMSKSYGNTIELFAEGNALKKPVMSIVTDSTPLEEQKNPDTCNVFALYSLFAEEGEKAELAAKYRGGNFGYGEAKKMLLAKIDGYFAPFRAKRKELLNDLPYVEAVLKAGAEKARGEAKKTMELVREATGFLPRPVV
jgi:tryptophanyl-tRNA synthetase